MTEGEFGCNIKGGEHLPSVGQNWALFLDFDGTLVDLAPTPGAVCLSPAVRFSTLRLFHLLGGAVAIVTGRTLSEIDRFVGLPDLPLAGSHGLEMRTLRKSKPQPIINRAIVADVIASANTFAAEHAGLLVEEKPAGVGIHYRARPDLAKLVVEHVHGLAKQFPEMELIPGKMLAELHPRGVDKGKAVTAFMAEPPFKGRIPVFIGDDLTDEDGFAAASSLGGFGIKIGEGETVAQYRLPTACASRNAIHQWVDDLSVPLKQASV